MPGSALAQIREDSVVHQLQPSWACRLSEDRTRLASDAFFQRSWNHVNLRTYENQAFRVHNRNFRLAAV